jgi:ATP-dependent DNA ligase
MDEKRHRIKMYCGPKRMILPAELPAFEKTGMYVIEEKMDGNWCLIGVGDGRIINLKSRVGIDFEGVESEGLMGLPLFQFENKWSGTLAGELVPDMVNGRQIGTRRLYLFDLMEMGQTDIRMRPWTFRRMELEQLYFSFSETVKARIQLLHPREDNFLQFYQETLARKGEGVVIKHKRSLYNPVNADGKIEDWLRCKPKRTVDYVVMATGTAAPRTYSPGGSPNFDLGLMKKTSSGVRLVKTLTVTLNNALKEWLNNRPYETLVGKVIECSGYDIFPSGALRHADVVRVRSDKTPEECTYEAAMRG